MECERVCFKNCNWLLY